MFYTQKKIQKWLDMTLTVLMGRKTPKSSVYLKYRGTLSTYYTCPKKKKKKKTVDVSKVVLYVWQTV